MEKFPVIFQLHIALRLRRINKMYTKMFVYAFNKYVLTVLLWRIRFLFHRAQHITHNGNEFWAVPVILVCLFIDNILLLRLWHIFHGRKTANPKQNFAYLHVHSPLLRGWWIALIESANK